MTLRSLTLVAILSLVAAPATAGTTAFASLEFGDSGQEVLEKIRAAEKEKVFQCNVKDCAYQHETYETVTVSLGDSEYLMYWTLDEDQLWEVLLQSYTMQPDQLAELKASWDGLVMAISAKHGNATMGSYQFPGEIFHDNGIWKPTHRWELEGKRIDVGVHCLPTTLRQGYECSAWSRIVVPEKADRFTAEIEARSKPLESPASAANLF